MGRASASVYVLEVVEAGGTVSARESVLECAVTARKGQHRVGEFFPRIATLSLSRGGYDEAGDNVYERKTRGPACATTACCRYEGAAPASAARRYAGAARESAPPSYTAAEDHPQCLGVYPR